jgi:tetrahydromethanopterin S-methyltransferase subunit G
MSLEKIVEYIKEDSEKKFEEIAARLEKLDEKIDDILSFKWQIIGGSVVLSVIVTIAFQILSIVWGR